MLHVPGVEIHTSDFSPKMIAEGLGQSLLKEQYNPDRVHVSSVDCCSQYDDGSIDLRTTLLVLDCLKHGERPRRGGREMIRTFLESNRMQPVGGQWIITIQSGIFRGNKPGRDRFMRAFCHLGYRAVQGSGEVRSAEEHEGDDPFTQDVFVLEKFGPPTVTEDMPWSEIPADVQRGFDLRREKPEKPAGKKKTKTKQPPKEEKGAYNDSFVVQPFSEGHSAQRVVYVGSEEEKGKKEKIRAKRKMLERCTNAVRVVMRGYLCPEDVPQQRWLLLRIDDVLTDGEHPKNTPHQVRSAYMEAVLQVVRSADSVDTCLNQLNAGQQKGQIIRDRTGKNLVYADCRGAPSGELYPLQIEQK